MEVLVDIMPEGVVVDIFLVVGEVVLPIRVAHVVTVVLEELHQLV